MLGDGECDEREVPSNATNCGPPAFSASPREFIEAYGGPLEPQFAPSDPLLLRSEVSALQGAS